MTTPTSRAGALRNRAYIAGPWSRLMEELRRAIVYTWRPALGTAPRPLREDFMDLPCMKGRSP